MQTYLSFSDPGDGHLAVTVRDKNLLNGLIVHIEYIDRDNVDDREQVEAFALHCAVSAGLHRWFVLSNNGIHGRTPSLLKVQSINGDEQEAQKHYS